MHRRALIKASGAFALVASGSLARGRAVWAQESDAFASLDLPQLNITLTESEFTVKPTELNAGWTLVNFVNSLPSDAAGPNIMIVPTGENAEQISDNISAAGEALPSWVYNSVFAGGPYAAAGKSAQAVIELTAGDWGFWTSIPGVPSTQFTVSGETTPVAPSDLTATWDVTIGDGPLQGLPTPDSSGPAVWAISNTTAAPQSVVAMQLPEGTTIQEFVDSIGQDPSVTPAPGTIDLASAPVVGVCTLVSSGRTVWVSLDLKTGTYGIVVFTFSKTTGQPTAVQGTATVFDVK